MDRIETQVHSDGDDSVLILMPLFNDWVACRIVLEQLSEVLQREQIAADVLIVDDASTIDAPEEFADLHLEGIQSVQLLTLRRNLGHQRAICVGLAYAHEHLRPALTIVMDSDGEDSPGDVPRLIVEAKRHGLRKIVFAERTRRSESLGFRVFYNLYRQTHRLLTGYSVRFGNFSAVPAERLGSLVTVSELWNHYVAANLRSRQPVTTIPTHRAKRAHGQTKMNFVGLVNHGLSGISVFSDVVGVRLACVSAILAVLALVGLLLVVSVATISQGSGSMWAMISAGCLFVAFLQAVLLSVVFSFVILSGKNSATFLPVRDYALFVGAVELLYGEMSEPWMPVSTIGAEPPRLSEVKPR